MKVLVTGATGYVGGRLVPRLLEAGYEIRAGGRSPAKLSNRSWARNPKVELVHCDVLEYEQVLAACKDCDVIYFLVHSMRKEIADFAKTDRLAADNVRRAAEASGVKRIIYLGGLGEESDDLSYHLRSRAEVANILSQGKVPVTTLRAGMIIGSGSASFEILRYLVERLPVMITPKWVTTPSQPIAIWNVIEYLVGCLDCPETIGQTLDIGGPEVLTYRELMQTYAEEAGLGRRTILPVPVFTPRLSSYWIHLVTPVPAFIARPLAEGLRNPVVCRENRIKEMIPQPLLTCREAIRRAIVRTQQQMVDTHWTDAGAMPVESVLPGDPNWAGGNFYIDARSIEVQSELAEIWKRIIRLGGTSGWYFGNWLWRLRGLMDRLVGGVGLMRGRRNAEVVYPGDALDFWRVVDVQPESRLLLFAEMKLPGKAWLEFRLSKTEGGCTKVEQRALFVPSGIFGLLYWWMVSPLHNYVFNGMLQSIVAKAPGSGGGSGQVLKQSLGSSASRQ